MSPKGQRKNGTPLGGNTSRGRKKIDDPRVTMGLTAPKSVVEQFKALNREQKRRVRAAAEKAVKLEHNKSLKNIENQT